MSVYGISRVLCRFYFYRLCGMKVTGQENLPEKGPFIILSNHRSMGDPFVLGVLYEQGELHFMAKEELFRNPVVRWYITRMHGFPVKRGQGDLSAMRTAMQVLRDGNALGIFPEGTRCLPDLMSTVETGVAFLALRSGAPLLPVYIDGKLRLFRRTDVYVGEPMDVSDLCAKGCDNDVVMELTARIRDTFLAMREA